jgi:hypothetical protein
MTPLRELARGFASGVRRNTTRRAVRRTAPPPAVVRAADEWTEVKDEASGLIYYWNERTDETTALGEPKPGPEGTSAFEGSGSAGGFFFIKELPPCAGAERRGQGGPDVCRSHLTPDPLTCTDDVWVGAPGRVGFPQQEQGGVASGLGGMVAAGAGIGLGHAVVGGIANSIFGGGSE